MFEVTVRGKIMKFYFNKAEIIEHDLDEKINKIAKTNDPDERELIFYDLLNKSYGELSYDGKYFNKDVEPDIERIEILSNNLARNSLIASEFVDKVIDR